MISKVALFILGIISENPINPYALSKVINYQLKNVKKSSIIPASTVYSIINMLQKKNFIVGEKAKNGNMPTRTVYSITKHGEELLRKNLISYLSSPESNLSELTLSILLINRIDQDAVLQALYKYRGKIEKEIYIREELFPKELAKHGEECVSLIALEHTLNVLKIDLQTVSRLIEKSKICSNWENSHVPFWRETNTLKKNK